MWDDKKWPLRRRSCWKYTGKKVSADSRDGEETPYMKAGASSSKNGLHCCDCSLFDDTKRRPWGTSAPDQKGLKTGINTYKVFSRRWLNGMGNDPNAWPKSSCCSLSTLCQKGGEIPMVWQLSIIRPIEKPSTKPGDPTTYWGILLESCLLKLLMTILFSRVSEWADLANILPGFQQGFLKGCRTENTVFILHTILQHGQYEHKDLYVLSLLTSQKHLTLSAVIYWGKKWEHLVQLAQFLI